MFQRVSGAFQVVAGKFKGILMVFRGAPREFQGRSRGCAVKFIFTTIVVMLSPSCLMLHTIITNYIQATFDS